MINLHNTLLGQWTTFKIRYIMSQTADPHPQDFFKKRYTTTCQSEIVLTPPPSSFISLLLHK